MTQTIPLPTVTFESLSMAQLQRMKDGAEQVIDAHRTLKKGSLNVVGECLKDQGTFFEMEHYPKGDVYDRESFSQYYYHAHRDDRDEHGHFHTFMRAGGIAADVEPVANNGDVEWPTGSDAVSHVISISMDSPGFPISLFATNRWVTGENWYRAKDVVSMLDNWQIDHAFPNLAVNQWVTGMMKLFRPQIVALLEHRDAVIEDWRQQHPDQDVFEDRTLEVTGEFDISVEDQLLKVLKAMEKLSAA